MLNKEIMWGIYTFFYQHHKQKFLDMFSILSLYRSKSLESRKRHKRRFVYKVYWEDISIFLLNYCKFILQDIQRISFGLYHSGYFKDMRNIHNF